MTKTPSPTHDEIARRAHQIWNDQGGPQGNDTAIWLEAERQVSSDSFRTQCAGSVEAASVAADVTPGQRHVAAVLPFAGAPAAGHSPAATAPVPSPDAIAAKADSMKNAARAPQQQHGKNAPKPMPAESGKPLWDKPHSS